MRILIAHDHPDDWTVLLREMSQDFASLSARQVADQSMFGEALTEGGFELAVTDHQLTWSDGFTVGRRLRARFPALPIVLFTARGSERIATAALRAGFDDYITRAEANWDEVRTAMRAALERGRQRTSEYEQKLRLTAVLGTVADAILTIDEAGVVESFNPAAERIFGYTAGEVIGRNVAMLMPSPFAQEHDRYLADYRRTGVGRIIGVGRELLGRRKTGEVFALELAITDTPLPSRRIFTGVCRDISPRKQAEGTLAEARGLALLAERAKSDFLSNISHELRTPLNAILGFTEVLLMELFGPVENPRHRGYLQDIRAGATRLFNSITSILDFVEASNQARMLVEQEVNLGALIHHASARHRVTADENGQHLTLCIASGLPLLRADELALRQILDNLLDNALKFSAPGGHIAVAVGRSAGGDVEITVSDDGTGIKPTEQEVVTRPFSQPGSPYARRTQGVGLGLPLSKTLIELHGGTLSLGSRDSGPGTTVTVSFPASRVVGAWAA
ncbi:MAG: PAS domain S-box protein [Azospirillum sp.]|nr:PAS domain S-box protein [Azospirillum sp.]